MSAPARVAGFLVALLAVFGVAVVAGQAVGPLSEPAPAHQAGHGGAATHRPAAAEPPRIPGGLMVSQNGYTLRLADTQAAAGRDVPVAFTVVGPDGRPVTAYDVEHGRRLHLIAVRRDLSGYQHVHPRLHDDGTWTTRLDLTPGQWRLFADFTPTGAAPLTLGADLAVPGDYRPAPARGTSRTATVDGYTVTLDGALTPGSDSRLVLSVSRNGRPVTDLQPYLGAYGHLVALRAGDLAYLHVHPEGVPGDGTTEPGPRVVFYASVPSTGTYRLYLDFRHEGEVRTAAFTLRAAPGTGATGAVDSAPAGAGHGDRHGH
jgi:hypothetical protein